MKAIGVFSKLTSILFPVIIVTLEIVSLVYSSFLEAPDYTDPKYYKGNYKLYIFI